MDMENRGIDTDRSLRGWLSAWYKDVFKGLVLALTGSTVIGFLWAANTVVGNVHPTITSLLSKVAICWLVIALPLVTLQAYADQRRKRIDLLTKGHPAFRFSGRRGFARNGSSTHTDVVFWLSVTNDGSVPASARSWSVWYEQDGLRLYGVDRWTLIDLLGERAWDGGTACAVIGENFCLTRPGMETRLVPSRKSIAGALQFVLPVPLESAVLSNVKVSCEASCDGARGFVFSGGKFDGVDDRAHPEGPEMMVNDVNGGFFL
jgi:hypothetical protein